MDGPAGGHANRQFNPREGVHDSGHRLQLGTEGLDDACFVIRLESGRDRSAPAFGNHLQAGGGRQAGEFPGGLLDGERVA
jgi:hypothetical protein